jgi:hypothetical protein
MTERIKHLVYVELADIIEHNLEGFLDLLAERYGDPLLMDIDYSIHEVVSDTEISLWVSGLPYEDE